MRVVCDYVAFVGGQDLPHVKEAAVVEVDGGRVGHWIFKAPYPWAALEGTLRAENERRTLKEHGIRWDDGFVDYADMQRTLKRAVHRATAIYAFGKLKAETLSKILGRTVVDIEAEFGAPSAEQSGFNATACVHPCHSVPSMQCSLRNARILADWFSYYRRKLATEHLCVKGCPQPVERVVPLEGSSNGVPGEC